MMIRSRVKKLTYFLVLIPLGAGFFGVPLSAQNVDIDADDIGGLVTSANGPEGGVWVIAETTDLPTKFARIVVTSDDGRYVIPDLPDANYEVFVRGYGLVDSRRVDARPGRRLNLTAVVAPDPYAAAQVYPAAYWLSMLESPEDPEAQRELALNMKQCFDCHQVGNKATREILPEMRQGTATTLEAWARRVQVGPSGPGMVGQFNRLGQMRERFAEWTDRIEAGESPAITPPRPDGVEQNVVLTLWDWGTELDARSDMVASDFRDPTVNANGPVYGVAEMTDLLTVLDPVTNVATNITVPSEGAPNIVSSFNASPTPSPHFGDDVWARSSDPRSSLIDDQGRVWFASRHRERSDQPEFCTSPDNPFAANYPLTGSGRQVTVYDPRTGTFEHINTCFTADHNHIDHDNVLYFAQGGAVAWIDMDVWDETHDAEAAQGWVPGVVDTNLDGRIGEWTEPDEPVDPAKDHRINFGCYAITHSDADDSLWCSGIGRGATRLTRISLGDEPPYTSVAEFFEPPPRFADMFPEMVGSGGVGVGSDGVVWQNWRVGGHFSQFDREKCESTDDRTAGGQSCPEGWSFVRKDDPTYGDGDSFYHANESYLTHFDTHNTLGLGDDAPVYGPVNTDAMEVYSPDLQRFVTLRVPYPLGFFPRSGNGRIDDPDAGWKGRGFWASFSTYATWHIEGGRGEGGPGVLGKVVKFQIRPDPLSR